MKGTFFAVARLVSPVHGKQRNTALRGPRRAGLPDERDQRSEARIGGVRPARGRVPEVGVW